MKKLILMAPVLLFGCISNSADTATPAPTNLSGTYKAQIFGGSVTWIIKEDGTGIACEERTSMNSQPKIRNIVVNGLQIFDVFEFEVEKSSADEIYVDGIMDMHFKRISEVPAACRALIKVA